MTERGLIVADPVNAAHYLERIGYYRLSGYALPFQKGGRNVDRHNFKPGATFELILDRYTFDRKLRLLAMDAIERIEIAVRAAMSNSIAVQHGPHWYMQSSLFESTFNHSIFIDEIKDQIGHDHWKKHKRDVFIEHYYREYNDPDMPACWMVFEALSFGIISRAYKNILYLHRKKISLPFGLPEQILSSWLHSISHLRNLCAHHSRLWNRDFRIKPTAANAYKSDMLPNDRLYAQLVVMQVLLTTISPGNHWADRLKTLFAEHPSIPLRSMGFHADWATRPIWN